MALKVSTTLYTAALAVAPFGDAENNQFLRPMVKFRIARSQILFDMAALPSFRYTLGPSLWLRA